MKTAQKRLFLDTKSAVSERAGRLETARNLFVVMRLGPPVVLSYLNARFEPRCGRKDHKALLLACCSYLLLLLLAKTCCSSLDPKRWSKTSAW